MTSGPSGFAFDSDLTPEENIQSFLAYLKAKDPKLADILSANIGNVLPLPSDEKTRSAARTKFNKAVAKALDSQTC